MSASTSEKDDSNPLDLLGLPEELLLEVLNDGLDLHDVLRFSRVCSRARVVSSTEKVWHRLYMQHFGVATGPHASTSTTNWRALFRARFVEKARAEKREHKVAVMKLRSSLLHLQAEVAHLEQQLNQERGRVESITSSMSRLRQCQTLENISGHWQPAQVQLYHNRIIQQTLVQGHWVGVQLQQQLEAAKLQVACVSNRLKAQRSRLQATNRKLKLLQG